MHTSKKPVQSVKPLPIVSLIAFENYAIRRFHLSHYQAYKLNRFLQDRLLASPSGKPAFICKVNRVR